MRAKVEQQATEQPGLPRRLQAVSASEQLDLLADHIRNEVAKARGVDASQLEMHQSLIEMGFDSVMAVELRNRIVADLGWTCQW